MSAENATLLGFPAKGAFTPETKTCKLVLSNTTGQCEHNTTWQQHFATNGLSQHYFGVAIRAIGCEYLCCLKGQWVTYF